MSLNNKTIVLHELIGLDCEVTNSSDQFQQGIRGIVVDETRNSLVLETSKGLKRVVKNISTFKFRKGKQVFLVKGEEINFRSYERLEKGLKFYKRRRL
ncbi:MAG: ribonuclease P protein subunit [Candidatus Marsarchaeota archaeon]|nr:ribonuclease P protein subunit [Candidatus Marsarchaeota archaeon]